MLKKVIIATILMSASAITTNGTIPTPKVDGVPCDFCIINDAAAAVGHALKEYLWCSWAGCA